MARRGWGRLATLGHESCPCRHAADICLSKCDYTLKSDLPLLPLWDSGLTGSSSFPGLKKPHMTEMKGFRFFLFVCLGYFFFLSFLISGWQLSKLTPGVGVKRSCSSSQLGDAGSSCPELTAAGATLTGAKCSRRHLSSLKSTDLRIC